MREGEGGGGWRAVEERGRGRGGGWRVVVWRGERRRYGLLRRWEGGVGREGLSLLQFG